MKVKYADLSKRHDETLQKYISTVEENRSLRTSQTSTPIKEHKVKCQEKILKTIKSPDRGSAQVIEIILKKLFSI